MENGDAMKYVKNCTGVDRLKLVGYPFESKFALMSIFSRYSSQRLPRA